MVLWKELRYILKHLHTYIRLDMIKRFIFKVLKFALLAGLAGLVVTILLFWYYSYDLPDYKQLAVYDPPVVTRIHANDGRLFAAFSTENRVFIPSADIPPLVKKAFIAVEDKNFYAHHGIDPMGILRAALVNIVGFVRDPHFKMGGSTITQQVAKNFCLTRERTISRKIKEAILAFRIEKAFSKEKILELYLNQIYFGGSAYGVGSAASEYFGKSLAELSPAEIAFLGGLPKAPVRYNPLKHMALAKARRDWVITRMYEEKFLTKSQALQAKATPLVVNPQFGHNLVNAPYYAEHIRQFLIKTYGQDALYKGGLSVRTTLDPYLQSIAERALQKGLLDYDKRVAGWRGPVTQMGIQNWQGKLSKLPSVKGMLPQWKVAVVLAVSPTSISIGLPDKSTGHVDFEQMNWARQVRIRADNFQTEVLKSAKAPGDVVSVGDVILVQELAEKGAYSLEQIPTVNGALIAMDPHTGKVLALTGGFSFEQSEFNRALQAQRQTGSSFKPFVYMAALENGMTPATILLDAPVVIDLGHDQGVWKPVNISNKFHGENTLRRALENSYNTSIIRLAQQIGMKCIGDVAIRFGLFESLPHQLSSVLGASETTLMKLTTAFGMMVNGGLKVQPIFIERIQDRHGKTIFKGQMQEPPMAQADPTMPPILPDTRPSVIDPVTAYQMVSILEGAVKNGTGKKAQVPGQIVGGKTGTTNDYKDTWFVGFSPDLVVGLYVGYDVPKTLGKHQNGSRIAAPIFGDFMQQALAGKRPIPFRIPSHAKLMRINADTGRVAKPGDKNTMLEVFKPSDKIEESGTTLPGSTGSATTAYNNGGIY
jgi:penicillin-binding protein 1A